MELVECGRRALRLSEKACADLWRQSNPVAPPAWEGRHACHECPFGAARCGQSVSPYAAARKRMALVCPSCCNATDRLINGERCVSCYNRRAEVRRGYDRKGSVPGLTNRLGSVTAAIIKDGKVKRSTFRDVTGAIEAAMMSARATSAPLAIGRCNPFLLASSLASKQAESQAA